MARMPSNWPRAVFSSRVTVCLSARTAYSTEMTV